MSILWYFKSPIWLCIHENHELQKILNKKTLRVFPGVFHARDNTYIPIFCTTGILFIMWGTFQYQQFINVLFCQNPLNQDLPKFNNIKVSGFTAIHSIMISITKIHSIMIIHSIIIHSMYTMNHDTVYYHNISTKRLSVTWWFHLTIFWPLPNMIVSLLDKLLSLLLYQGIITWFSATSLVGFYSLSPYSR